MKAIETNYAGCRFRSRLEARWAVFFNKLGYSWNYEPQGYVVSDRYDKQKPYLPDFWLPSLQLWVEVKGLWSPDELETVCYATLDVDGLPAKPHGERLDDSTRNRPRILLLGSIDSTECVNAWLLAHNKGDVVLSRYAFDPSVDNAQLGNTIWCDAPEWRYPAVSICAALNGGFGPIKRKGPDDRWQWRHEPIVLATPVVRSGLVAARSARFEHGEKP